MPDEALPEEKIVEALETRRQELIEDLAWREHDLEHEKALLKKLAESEEVESLIDFGPQSIVVRVQKDIVEAHRAELEGVEKRLKQYREKSMKPTAPE